MASDARSVGDKWAAPRAGESYATRRFASSRAAARDPLLVASILREHGVRGAILDAPCGTGRLRETLERFGERVVELDVSASMLAQSSGARVLGSVDALPIADASFDVVVSCRFLHHLHERAALQRAIQELVRVSRRLVVASFWDARSWPALRVRMGWKAGEGPRGRTAISREVIADAFASAGARVIEFRSTLRFVSQQTFVVAERS